MNQKFFLKQITQTKFNTTLRYVQKIDQTKTDKTTFSNLLQRITGSQSYTTENDIGSGYSIKIFGKDTANKTDNTYTLTISQTGENDVELPLQYFQQYSGYKVYQIRYSDTVYKVKITEPTQQNPDYTYSFAINEGNYTDMTLSNDIYVYRDSENSITYTLAQEDTKTTSIEEAITKINNVLGTILTELKSETLTLFGDEISNNVSTWESMIDKLLSNIGNISNLTTTQKSSLTAAANELKTRIDSLGTAIGTTDDQVSSQNITTYTQPLTKSTSSQSDLVGMITTINSTLSSLVDAIIELNKNDSTIVKEMTRTEFKTFVSTIPSQNGVVYVNGIKIIAGDEEDAYTTTDNILTLGRTDVRKIVFQNFTSEVSLKNMFCFSQASDVDLTIEFDLETITINNLFEDAFINNGPGTYDLTISFPNLTSITGTDSLKQAFMNNLSGNYILSFSAPKLITLQNSNVENICKNTTGTYTINKFYLPLLSNALNNNVLYNFLPYQTFWAVLNNQLISIDSTTKALSLKYTESEQQEQLTILYVHKQISINEQSTLLLLKTSSTITTPTTGDLQKLSYYSEYLGQQIGQNKEDIEDIYNEIDGIKVIIDTDKNKSMKDMFEKVFKFNNQFTEDGSNITFDTILSLFTTGITTSASLEKLIKTMVKEQTYDLSFTINDHQVNLLCVLTRDDILKIAFEYSELVANIPQFTLCYKYGSVINNNISIYDYQDGFINQSGNEKQYQIQQLQTLLDQQKYTINKLEIEPNYYYCIFNDQEFLELIYKEQGIRKTNIGYFVRLYNYGGKLSSKWRFIIDAFDISDPATIFSIDNITIDQFKVIIMNMNTTSQYPLTLSQCILFNCKIIQSQNSEETPSSGNILGIINSDIQTFKLSNLTFQFIINSNLIMNNIKSISQATNTIGVIYNSNINQSYIITTIPGENDDKGIIENTFQNILIYKSTLNILNIGDDSTNYWYPTDSYATISEKTIGKYSQITLSSGKNGYIYNSNINLLNKELFNTTSISTINTVLQKVFNYTHTSTSTYKDDVDNYDYSIGIIQQNNTNIILKDNQFQGFIANYNTNDITFNTIYHDVDFELYNLLLGDNLDYSTNTFINNF